MPYIGYINYVVFLFMVTGILILRFDAKIYDMAEMKKEKKAAHFIGWANVTLGVLAFVANWAFQKWF
jgi:uncharacterized membrane protein